MNKKKILILEDNEIIRKGIITYLKDEFLIEGVPSIGDFKNKYLKDVDLFILDVNLPDGNAYELVPEIKNLDKPIIFLTVKDLEEDILKGFSSGGDDYITKPFKLSILKARVESVLRRVSTREDSSISYKEMTLDLEGTRLYIRNKEISLTSKQYLLMELFMKNIGRTLSRDILLEATWDSYGEFVNDNALSVAIGRLRDKLGDFGNHIKTVRGLGYKFE